MCASTQQFPDNAPFGDSQRLALEALIPTISPPQAAWLAGYFAALGQLPENRTMPGSSASPAEAIPLTILYGSESGNAEGCAAMASQAAAQAGFKPSVFDMAEVDTARLRQDKHLLLIVSTWGEGDPPEGAVGFHDWLMGDQAPSLAHARFAVFALGDTSYADFCACGKRMDARLAELGARRVLDRVDADVDFEPPFQNWLKAVLPEMAKVAGLGQGPVVEVNGTDTPSALAPAAGPAVLFGKKHPFPAPVKQLINLNGRGSAKLTCHLELSLEGSGMTYQPGDVVGVIPRNCPEVVTDFLGAAGLTGEEGVEDESGSQSLREALETRFDVTSVNPAFIKRYAEVAGNADLDPFLAPENKESLKQWLWGREIRDLFLEFPPRTPIQPPQLLGLLRKIPPRLYSIASSLRAHPGEVHLTVGAVFYESLGRLRKGVCSSYLCQRVGQGDTVRLYTHHNKNFCLPDNPETPLIMVGPGTGIAPFRAFVEERAALGATGPNWLFFGDQHFNSDFLYQLEWQDYLKKGVLSRLDVAFSRDTDHKIYVQHRMKQAARQLYAWLQEGAFFYVCGDATRMAKDVHQALIEIYAEQGGLSLEAAEVAVKELQKTKRYQRDVY